MPENKRYETVAKDVRKGDLIVDGPSKFIKVSMPATVTGKDVKSQYTYIETEFGGVPQRTIRVPNEETLDVERTEPTQAELAEKQHARAVETLTDSLAFWTGPQQSTRATVEEMLAKNVPSGGTVDDASLTHWNIDTLIQQQAVRRVWQTVEYVCANQAVAKGWDIVEVVARVLAEELGNDLEDFPSSPLSRSTSITSNLMEDVKRWAPRQIIKDIRYAARPVLDRIEQIRKEA